MIWQEEGRQPQAETAKEKSPSVSQGAASESNVGQVRNGVTPKASPSVTANADPSRFRRAYLLCLSDGKLSLESTQDIEGDFAPRRGQTETWSGMLRCRLVSAEGTVLAEELMTAPDRVCTVLDSHEGMPQPAKFTVPGPVLFQLRLPRLTDAIRLDVSRITGPGALAHDVIVGSVALTTP